MRGSKQQQGIVLVVGLVMLISLTLIGVTAMKSTTIDERIAANTQFKAIAFQVAESILADSANWDGAAECYLAECKDEVADFLRKDKNADGTPKIDGIKTYITGVGDAKGKGEMNYMGEFPIAGYSIGGPILTPVVELTGCASDGAICGDPNAKLGNTNAKALHNMGVALVGVKP